MKRKKNNEKNIDKGNEIKGINLNEIRNEINKYDKNKEYKKDDNFNDDDNDGIKVISLDDMKNLTAKLTYDESYRNNVKKNHTGTHLLNHTLRKFFKGIDQKGSLVDDKKLRFDFSYGKNITKEEIYEIEKYMNDTIKGNKKINIKYMKFDTLIHQDDKSKGESVDNKVDNSVSVDNSDGSIDDMNDVIFLRDEKYPETVRIVSIDGLSDELCGGTHVENTGEIERIRIVSEGSISSNTRRIIAYTGKEALRIENNYKNGKDIENNVENDDFEIPYFERLCMAEERKKKEKERIETRKKK